GRMPSNYIDGVYNYCDGWHERCRFQNQCRLYRTHALSEAARRAGLDDAQAEAWVDAQERRIQEEEQRERAREEAADPALARRRAEFIAIVAEANRPVTDEEQRRFDAIYERQHEFTSSHPLHALAREYMELAEGTIEVLRPLLEARANSIAIAAVDTI